MSNKFAKFSASNKSIPINNIFCIGKNYLEHAKEMGGGAPSEPIIFLKPNSSIIFNGEKIILPKISNNVHHEVELVVLIGKDGKNISETNALDFVEGFGIGLDITMRDLQSDARKIGNPWAVSKGFDTSAPISDFVEKNLISAPNNLEFDLKINGTLRQKGNTSNMIFSVEKLISYLSNIFTLQVGDLIFTGTPEGVGKIIEGDKLVANLNNFTKLEVSVAE
ncbi:MAG: fumarylacetoacetate hydrolase family protein [Bacteroidota bacterium]